MLAWHSVGPNRDDDRLLLEKEDHFAKRLHLAPNGIDVEPFHVFGRT
jgi:hypothetical protein